VRHRAGDYVPVIGLSVGTAPRKSRSLSVTTGESLAHLNCLIARGKMKRTRDANSVHWYERA
jgi:hypothetical protein